MTKVDKRKKGINPPRCHHKHLVKIFQFLSKLCHASYSSSFFMVPSVKNILLWRKVSFLFFSFFPFSSFPFSFSFSFSFPFLFLFLFLSIPFPLNFTLLFDHHHFNCYFNSKIYDFIWYVLFSRRETCVFSCLFVSLVNQNSAILIKSMLDFVDKHQIQEDGMPVDLKGCTLSVSHNCCWFAISLPLFFFWIWIVFEIKSILESHIRNHLPFHLLSQHSSSFATFFAFLFFFYCSDYFRSHFVVSPGSVVILFSLQCELANTINRNDRQQVFPRLVSSLPPPLPSIVKFRLIFIAVFIVAFFLKDFQISLLANPRKRKAMMRDWFPCDKRHHRTGSVSWWFVIYLFWFLFLLFLFIFILEFSRPSWMNNFLTWLQFTFQLFSFNFHQKERKQEAK